jgi:hypothetical protein
VSPSLIQTGTCLVQGFRTPVGTIIRFPPASESLGLSHIAIATGDIRGDKTTVSVYPVEIWDYKTMTKIATLPSANSRLGIWLAITAIVTLCFALVLVKCGVWKRLIKGRSISNAQRDI